MKNKGFFSQDFIVQVVGLVFSIVFVYSIYSNYIWPKAQNIEITTRLQASQNPEAPIETNRSIAVILKNHEQMFCLMLMLWACIIIGYKFFRVHGEQSMQGYQFLNISRGERIIPEEALIHHKDVEGQMRRNGRLRNKILPDVILAALHRFDSTQSIQDASHAVQERTAMAYEQLESDLSLVRYIAWAIPSVGFIGTVRGIGEALSHADKAIKLGDISDVTASLGLAFNSTLIALVLSIVLMFFVHLLQSKQEHLLIDLEDFATKKVVGMMKKPESEESKISFT